MGATDLLAGFISSHSYQELSRGVCEKSKQGILDCFGVTLAGATEPAGNIIAELIREYGGEQKAPVIAKGFKTNSANAALIWGTMAHALDFDDWVAAMLGHPSVTIVPVLFTLGAELGASGKQIIDAYVVGLEVEGKLGRAMAVPQYVNGWHLTNTIGAIGAAAAAARLLELDEKQIRMALGIAASEAGGLRQNFGTMTKPLHAGKAARSGIFAAQLAKKGFTADGAILESQFGFGNVFTGAGKFSLDEPLAILGSPYEIEDPGLIFKKYPSCGGTHRSLDAIFEIIARHNVKAEDVEAVDCLVCEQLPRVLIHSRPTTGLEGKFSMQYCLAAALVYREVKIETFTNEKVNDARIQELIPKVKMVVNPELQWGQWAEEGYDVVTVKLKSGAEYSCRVDFQRGSTKNPLSWGELIVKFRNCAQAILDEDVIDKVITKLCNLEEEKDVNNITNLVL